MGVELMVALVLFLRTAQAQSLGSSGSVLLRAELPLPDAAYDLSGNSEVWARPLRDTAFRGALPPQS